MSLTFIRTLQMAQALLARINEIRDRVQLRTAVLDVAGIPIESLEGKIAELKRQAPQAWKARDVQEQERGARAIVEHLRQVLSIAEERLAIDKANVGLLLPNCS